MTASNLPPGDDDTIDLIELENDLSGTVSDRALEEISRTIRASRKSPKKVAVTPPPKPVDEFDVDLSDLDTMTNKSPEDVAKELADAEAERRATRRKAMGKLAMGLASTSSETFGLSPTPSGILTMESVELWAKDLKAYLEANKIEVNVPADRNAHWVTWLIFLFSKVNLILSPVERKTLGNVDQWDGTYGQMITSHLTRESTEIIIAYVKGYYGIVGGKQARTKKQESDFYEARKNKVDSTSDNAADPNWGSW